VSTRQILGAVGAAIGGYFFGPTGAQWGWAIGSAIGGAVDPEIIKGPSVGDIAAQTSQEGVPRPIVFALSQPMSGNIIASSEPRIVRRRERQGKGGPKVETESVYRTYAIGVCEGPITRFVRVWRNNQLVYDAESAEMSEVQSITVFGQLILTGTQNGQFLVNARFFLGTWDQNPSPNLETIFGVGTTPAYRGTAYMVMADEDLTDLRGAIPQYTFQVERCEGFYLTSRPYAIQAIDALDSVGSVEDDGPFIGMPTEALDSVGSIQSGAFGAALEVYNNGLPEALDSTGSITSGVLDPSVVTYGNYPPEALDSVGSITSGVLDPALLAYENYPPEALDSTGTIESGSLV
jgi:hypothetical protein